VFKDRLNQQIQLVGFPYGHELAYLHGLRCDYFPSAGNGDTEPEKYKSCIISDCLLGNVYEQGTSGMNNNLDKNKDTKGHKQIISH
jgi:hypothetical protein